jgi:hypothetical protein
MNVDFYSDLENMVGDITYDKRFMDNEFILNIIKYVYDS